MKKYLLILLICLFPSICFGAISAEMVWEVRTTGSQVYSGGFNTTGTGKDYSQADTCLTSWVTGSTGGCNQTGSTNVTNDLATSGTWTTLGSASANFTASMVRNTVHITGTGTSNFIPGWYEITAFNSTSSVTLDRACATGDSTAGTGYLGGAFKLGGNLDSDFFAANMKAPGNTVYIQSGAYTLGESIATPVAGTAALPISLIGYVTNRATIPYGTDRPSIAAGNSYTVAPANYWDIENIQFTKTGGSSYLLGLGAGNTLKNIKASNSTATASQYAVQLNTNNTIISSDISCTNGWAIYTNTNIAWIYGSYIHDSVYGVYGGGPLNVVNCILDTNSTAALRASTANNHFIYGNTFYNGASPAGSAVTATSGTYAIIMNNIFEGFSTPVVWTTASPTNILDYNAYYNNTSASNSDVTEGIHSVNLVASPFTDAPNADFRVGTNVKALGFPAWGANLGVGATCIGYPDIGAVQRVEPTAGGGASAFSF